MVRHRSLDPAFVGSNPPAPASFDIGAGDLFRGRPLLFFAREFPNWSEANEQKNFLFNCRLTSEENTN